MRPHTVAHKKKISDGLFRAYGKKARGFVGLNGYRVISRGRGNTFYEHRLVWEAAHGKIPKGFFIHHLNHDRLDNRIENLQLMESGDHSYMHAKERGFGLDRKGIPPTNKMPPNLIRAIRKLIDSGVTRLDVLRIFPMSPTTLWKIDKHKHICQS